MAKRIMITGGCGFIGHHFVEHFLKNTDWEIIVIDKLSYASSGFDRLRDIECYPDNSRRIKIFPIDLNCPIKDKLLQEIPEVDYILNLASESHVDNSITEPIPFIQNNVSLTLNLLEWARQLKTLKRFVQFSTDEVYGTAPVGTNYKEGDRFNCGNPYSASKGAQECLCTAWSNTYKIPICITNTMNVIGERQHPEKFVPLIIKKVLQGDTVIIHSDPTLTIPGSRFYIHARNVAQAIHFVLGQSETLDNVKADKGKYHIVGEREVSNLELAQMIASFIGKPLHYKMVDFHSSRPGHDLRYALDGSKMTKLGWKPPLTLEQSLENTVKWLLNRPEWLK